jgi:hypothetical protein
MFLCEYTKSYVDAFEARHGQSQDDDEKVTDCDDVKEPEPFEYLPY